MALRDRFRRMSTSQEEQDRDALARFCAERTGGARIADLVPRQHATVAGEITSMRIVPARDGSSWLEATVTDGTGTLVVLWMGRRRIAGVRPGTRLLLTGRPTPAGRTGRPTLYNPEYELL